MTGFVLDDKGDPLVSLEVEQGGGTYGAGVGPSNLVVTGDPNDLKQLQAFSARKIPDNISVETGPVSRRSGLPLANVGYSTEYAMTQWLRELTMIATDVATPKLRPNVHQILRSTAFALPVFANALDVSTLVYSDETFPEEMDSIEAAYYEYVSDKTRNRIDCTGGLSDLQVTWEPGRPIIFEAINGKFITVGDGVAVAGASSVDFSPLSAVIPFNASTLVLQTLGGGSVYPTTSPIRKIVLRTKSNNFVTPDGRGANGRGRVFNNPWEHAELDVLVDETKPGGMSMRQVWADNTVVQFTGSTPGPTVVTNTFGWDFYMQGVGVEPSKGPGNEKLSLYKGMLLWSGGLGAVGNENAFTFSSAATTP